MAALFVGLLIYLVSSPAHAQDFRQVFTSVTPANFDSGGAVSRQFHLNAESYLTMSTVARRTEARKLVFSPRPELARQFVSREGGDSSLADYAAQDPLLDGVIVLHDGVVVFEAYPNMHPWQRHFAWSVTKVVTSTALAALVEDGLVDMDAPIERYLPVLANSDWAGIPVRDVANMASGIDCLDSDGYQDPATCIYTMEESLGITATTGRELDFVEHLRKMRRHRPPGTRHEYVSANTNVLGLVIEAVSGKPYATALQELIWNSIGAESDALVAISGAGYAYASGGLHARLRDVARFGQIYVQPEVSSVLSGPMIRQIQDGGIALAPEELEGLKEGLGDDLPVRGSWQWDLVWSDGALFKSGYSGQGLYVDPARKLVIAWFGTGLDFSAQTNQMLPVARQLARSGLFGSPGVLLPGTSTEKH
ncbi:MAG: beta-lactamase family protein [Steroidobacteraceae bacterium]|jgi:CubicO group peptidase (beta-lactamase class C family)|nr:beta-lactamase family protein [Steroidobacteraceae bacterium]